MRGTRIRHKSIAFALGGLAAFLAYLAATRLDFLRNIEHLSYDLRVQAAKPPPLDPRIVHVNIDDGSVRPEALGRWPWHRDVHARLVDALTDLGAEAIVFDVEFVEPEPPYLDPEIEEDVRRAAELVVGGRDEPGVVRVILENVARIRKLLDEGKTDEADTALLQLREDMGPYGERLKLYFEGLYVRPDDEFADAIRRSGRVALPISFIRSRATNPEAPRIRESSWSVPEPDAYDIGRSIMEPPLPALAEGAAAFGGVDNQAHDTDRILRRSPLLYRYGARVYGQLSLKVALDASGRHWSVEEREDSIVLRNELGESVEIPVDARGTTLLDWSRESFPQYGYFQVFEVGHASRRIDRYFGKLEALMKMIEIPVESRPARDDLRAFLDRLEGTLRAVTPDAEYRRNAREWALEYVRRIRALEAARRERLASLGENFRGKIVIIGSTERASTDLKATSIDKAMPGVFFHSTLINMVLQRRFVRPVSRRWSMFIVLLAASAAAAVAAFGRPVVTGPVTLGIAGAYVVLAFLVFSSSRTVLPVVAPVLCAAVPYVVITGYRLATEERERRLVRTLFQHYLSPQLVERLLDDPARAGLGGERREVTVFFSDVHGFTSFVENNPSDVAVKTLNEYLQTITEVILRNGGYLDKYLGDGILALFGVFGGRPEDGAAEACRTALEAQVWLGDFRRRQEGMAHPLQETRIGIASGHAVVGNIGSRERFDYTAIGDAVNVAARLQVLNKRMGTRVLIEERTRELVAGKFLTRSLGEQAVEGRQKPVSVHELLGLGT